MMRMATLVLALALCEAGCQREERQFRLDPPVAESLDKIALMPNRIGGAPPPVYFALAKPYEANAYNLSQGKRLYSWFGCEACHGHGEGGIGPAFLDGWWYYGPEMVSIFASIRDGRPHGMPAYRDRMTTEQIWQLAGYVQTIGSYAGKTAAPSRNDEKHVRPAENRAPAKILFDPGPTPVHPNQGPTP
jgi:cytochrome c oxidase cbb3-type subunit III